MFGKNEEKQTNDEETIIGPSVLVKGDFTSNGNVVMEGSLEGHIKSGGKVIVGPRAKINADIEASSADVAGEITGNLKVEGSLTIQSGAKINGDVECSSISIEEGGILNGKCNMRGDKQESLKEATSEPKEEKEIPLT